MERLWQDVRYGARTLAGSPGFTLIAVVTLALGIGVNTSMFSVIEATILGGLPYPEASRLVRVFRTAPQSQSWPHSAANVYEYMEKNRSFDTTAAFSWWSFNLAESGQQPTRLQGVVASGDLFKILGMPPALGRAFGLEDDAPGKNDVIVLSHRFWVRHYGADAGVVGRTVRVDGRPTTIVGVMPAGADYQFFWGPVDIWRPLGLTEEQRRERGNNWLSMMGRLKPGVSAKQAEAEIALLLAQIKKSNADEANPDGIRVLGLLESAMDTTGRTVSFMCLALAGLVLLIACANIANLQLARVARRGRELAVRAALGAGRFHLLRQSLVETLLLGALGGAVGLLVAVWCNDFLGRSIVIGDQSGVEIPLNWTILGYAMAISLAAGIAAGLFPSWMATRAEVGGALKQGGRGTAGGSQHRLRNGLIVAQMALALVLLAASALFVSGLRRFMSRETGWTMDHVLAGYVVLPEQNYPDDAKRRAFAKALVERLTGEAGFEKAAIASSLPIWAYGTSTNLQVEGQPEVPASQLPLFYTARVSPDFFATLGIPVVQGVAFARELRDGSRRVAIVNEATARHFWPNESAIGKRLGAKGDSANWREVVGVVRDVAYPAQLGQPDTYYQMYTPVEQDPPGWFAVAVRSQAPPAAAADVLRRTVASLDPDLPVSEVATPAEQVRHDLTSFGLAGQVLTGFGLLGLLLAALGIYGVITNVVVQRTSEFGIRVAVGAQVRDILWLVLAKGLRLSLAGVAIGCAGAAALARVLVSAVPSLQSDSAGAVLSVSGVLLVVAGAACWLPAWRATRVDPLVALRQE